MGILLIYYLFPERKEPDLEYDRHEGDRNDSNISAAAVHEFFYQRSSNASKMCKAIGWMECGYLSVFFYSVPLIRVTTKINSDESTRAEPCRPNATSTPLVSTMPTTPLSDEENKQLFQMACSVLLLSVLLKVVLSSALAAVYLIVLPVIIFMQFKLYLRINHLMPNES
jgi:hypothetical protein